jgi:enolase
LEAKNLTIREILATNCKKTIEVELETEKYDVRASVPMGTSTGKYEAISLPVKEALKKFQEVKKNFILENFYSQEEVDAKLRDIDKTPNFSKIGGNLALAISSAYLKAFAMHNGQEVFEYFSGRKMPRPLCNVAGGWGEESEIQEFLLLPERQKSFKDVVFRISNAYLDLGKILKKKDKAFKFSKNYESGWVTSLSTEKLLKILSDLCKDYKLRIGMDVAASDRWNGKKYRGRNEKKHRDFISKLIKKFDILFMEDPFHQDDFDSFSWLTRKFKNTIVCGDDLYVTNPERLRIGIEKNATNAVLIKPNQIGTITDTIKVVNMAKKHKMTTVISHRSGTTDETLLCHLAVGLGCDLAKFGISGERIIKINELLRIEEKLHL